VNDPSNVGSRFEGYTTEEASEKRILRNVFAPGDAWVRTGDLMRKDDNGYFYFVDRIGDTFRRKGENVSTTEVSQAICAFRGVSEANVYGVSVPNTEGRVGMAALVAEENLDLAGLRKHLVHCLPAYARPVFLRIGSGFDVTGTFKYSKTKLICQGYDPLASADALYFDSLESEAFVQLDKEFYDRIQSGGFDSSWKAELTFRATSFHRSRRGMHMQFDQIRDEFAKLESEIADGPLSPM